VSEGVKRITDPQPSVARVVGMPVTRSFLSHPSALYPVRQFLRERAAQAELPKLVAEDLLLATSEACTNAVVHTQSRRFEVTWTLSDEDVCVRVRDEGVFIRRVPMQDAAEPDGSTSGGRGIPLMLALVDEMSLREGTWRRPGTAVRLIKRFAG
jgi:anti-sigma regulatory factor (Ser/Thr protein kinase)